MKCNQTLSYYEENAKEFTKGTLQVDFSYTQNKFLAKLEEKAYILDFGCGSGRDTKYFLENENIQEVLPCRRDETHFR